MYLQAFCHCCILNAWYPLNYYSNGNDSSLHQTESFNLNIEPAELGHPIEPLHLKGV